jgi:hypothetical protein
MLAADLLLYVKFLINKTACPNVEIINNVYINFKNSEDRDYSQCHFLCVTYTHRMTSNVVGLFTEFGGVLCYLEHLSSECNFDS